MARLALTFRPHWENGSISNMQVSAILSSFQKTEGPLLTAFQRTVGIPFAKYDGLTLADENGTIAYIEKPVSSNQCFVELIGIFSEREVTGSLKWEYTVYPRVLPEGYTSSPYFDFRAETGGFNSAGITFLFLPADDKWETHIHWDLSDLPDGARGVWSLGTDDIACEADAETLRFSYYMAGLLHAQERGEFGIYWFGDVPFDIDVASKRIRDLFSYMCEFFHDTEPVYRVFLRRDPFEKSGGGTALARSFMSGYSAIKPPDIEHWLNVLAHEMVHNWPSMNDEPAGAGTWYAEGIAEYYSALLPLRAGLADAEETARQITNKAARYYECPLRYLSNDELAAIYWSDRRAQAVPYGRGFVYLANVDAQLKRAGKGGIDEIGVRYQKGNPMEPENWISFLRDNLGEQAIVEFEEMKAGKLLTPDPDGFSGLFTVTEKQIEIDNKPELGYEWRVRP